MNKRYAEIDFYVTESRKEGMSVCKLATLKNPASYAVAWFTYALALFLLIRLLFPAVIN
jgi:hypothetical protein